LWWLYFGAAAEHSRAVMSMSDDPGRLARDAYTYLQLPIVAGIIATAVGDDLLIAEPHRPLHGVGLAMVLGGPALYLLGEYLFRRRMTGAANIKRLAVAAVLLLLAPLGAPRGRRAGISDRPAGERSGRAGRAPAGPPARGGPAADRSG
jgi:low temperature requirement protein LtrA